MFMTNADISGESDTAELKFTTVSQRKSKGRSRKESPENLQGASISYLSALKQDTIPLEQQGLSSTIATRSLDEDLRKYAVDKSLSLHPFVSDTLGFHYLNPSGDPLLYILTYKTQKCTQKPCSRLCEKYHNAKEKRRSPLEFPYSEHPCSHVKSGNSCKTWGDPIKCSEGDQCRHSHTLLEQMYHPNIYKTDPCNKADCTWGPLCTHSHGRQDVERQSFSLERFRALLEKKTIGGKSYSLDRVLRWILLDETLEETAYREDTEFMQRRSVGLIKTHPQLFMSENAIITSSFSSFKLESTLSDGSESPRSSRSRSQSSELDSQANLSRPSKSVSQTVPIPIVEKKKGYRSMSSSAALTQSGSFFTLGSYLRDQATSISSSSTWDFAGVGSFDWSSQWRSDSESDEKWWKSKAMRLAASMQCKNCEQNERVSVCVPCGHQMCVQCAQTSQKSERCAFCQSGNTCLVYIKE